MVLKRHRPGFICLKNSPLDDRLCMIEFPGELRGNCELGMVLRALENFSGIFPSIMEELRLDTWTWLVCGL